jgi:hypothetical protein
LGRTDFSRVVTVTVPQKSGEKADFKVTLPLQL